MPNYPEYAPLTEQQKAILGSGSLSWRFFRAIWHYGHSASGLPICVSPDALAFLKQKVLEVLKLVRG